MPQALFTAEFSKWLGKLRDREGRNRVLVRIRRLEDGNAGDHKRLSGRVWELRVDFGPGYRVYYMARGLEVVILLAGGDKSTQRTDIAKAEVLAATVENDHAD